MIGVLIQARSGSSRFPRKIYEDLNGKTLLYRVLESAKMNVIPHKIILLMPEYDKDEFETRFDNGEFGGATDERFETYFGHPDDVLDRYYNAARQHEVDLIVRLTGDCPFCGICVDEMLVEYLSNSYNGFMGNNYLVSQNPMPCGVDAEIFPYWLLAKTHKYAKPKYEREHVVPHMYSKTATNKIYGFSNNRPNTIISNKFEDFSFDTEEDKKLLAALTKNYDDEIRNNKSPQISLNRAIDKTYSEGNFK